MPSGWSVAPRRATRSRLCSEFPDGLTTAELASVMRPSDLVDADLEATAAGLAELAEAGAVVARAGGPATGGAWRDGAQRERRELQH